MKRLFLIFSALMIAGCGGLLVQQKDLDAWVGMPVEALDTHSFFITLPVVKTITESGIEIRNYPNKRGASDCFDFGGVKRTGGYASSASYSSFASCTSRLQGCDNIFYIKNSRVVEYAPTGSCTTNSSLQPEPRYLKLIGQ